MKIPGKIGDFWPEELDRLQQAYTIFKERKSEATGSAWGEHFRLAEVLRDMGVEVKGKEGAELEYLTEYVLTYKRIPK